jgi:hypothetical protein
MKRLLVMIFIVILVAACAVWEQIFLSRTYKELDIKLTAVVQSVKSSPEDSVDTEQNKSLISDLYEFWLQKERTLMFLVRHNETFQISDSIIYAKNFIDFNNKEEAMVALTKLEYLFSVRHYNIGTSWQNLI